MSVDLSKLSKADLATLIKTARTRKRQIESRPTLTKARTVVMKAITASGYTLSELFPNGTADGKPAKGSKPVKTGKAGKAGKAKGQRKQAPIKYRNPDDHTQVWTGRGRTPVWMSKLIEETGIERDYFLVSSDSAQK